MKNVILDICSVCPHKCVYCFHQRNQLSKNIIMQPEVFNPILNIIKKEKYSLIHLYMSGESFVNPNIYDYIESIGKNKISISLATKLAVNIDFNKLKNCLSLFTEKTLFQFIIEIDGFNQESISPIANVDFENLKNNLNKLLIIKKELSKHNIMIEFTTIVNSYNENNISQIQYFLNRIGFKNNIYKTKAMGLYKCNLMNKEDAIALLPKPGLVKTRIDYFNNELVYNKKICKYLKRPAISPEGNVTICCHDMLYEINCGNVLEEESLNKILNSSLYKNSISLGRSRNLSICKGCN